MTSRLQTYVLYSIRTRKKKKATSFQNKPTRSNIMACLWLIQRLNPGAHKPQAILWPGAPNTHSNPKDAAPSHKVGSREVCWKGRLIKNIALGDL